MLKAVLFDLDGTIIDSNNAIFETYTQVAKRLGVEPPDIEVLRGLLGQPSNLNLPILFGDNKDARPIYNEVVIKTHENLPTLPHVKETLEKIDLPMGIVTSKRKANAIEVLGELYEKFDVLVTPEQTVKQKPDPEPMHLACKKLSVKPEECVYIGDTVRDYKTARNSGTEFIALIDKGSTAEQFNEIGAKNQVTAFDMIPDMITKFYKETIDNIM